MAPAAKPLQLKQLELLGRPRREEVLPGHGLTRDVHHARHVSVTLLLSQHLPQPPPHLLHSLRA